MKAYRKLLAGGLTVAVVVAACVGTGVAASSARPLAARSASAHSASSSPVIKLETVAIQSGSKSIKHVVLVNGSGRAIYLLSGDTTKKPKCISASCRSDWPPVTSSAKHPVVGKGVTGTVAIWRHNGINQVTIDGHPLYTYAGDSGANQANGQGVTSFGGTWKVVSGTGSAAALSSSSSGSGSGW